MIRPGLVSVTFRQLKAKEIVEFAAACGLEGIEWGGDIHVTDPTVAREVAKMTNGAGLTVAAYGSYWRAAGGFGPTLETAVALGAPTVRVWAGSRGSADETDRETVVAMLRDACELATSVGLTISLEFHDGTLTDTLYSALRLAMEVDHPALRFLWQPHPNRSLAVRKVELWALSPRLSNLHVFQWTRPHGETLRHPLSEGTAEWREIFERVEGDRFALLEFVPGDDPGCLAAEAEALRWCIPGAGV